MINQRFKPLWKLVKDLNKGTMGFYRDGIPYCVFSVEEWSSLVASPVIIGKESNDKPKDDVEVDDSDIPIGCA